MEGIDSQLLILEYVFKKYNYNILFGLLSSFFEDGRLFPALIALIYHENEIPGTVLNPENPNEIKKNNELALEFLFQKNEYIRRQNPNFKKSGQSNLIYLIITELCFKIDEKVILHKCNLIIKPLKKVFKKKNDLIKYSSLLTILNVLTKGKIEIKSDEEKDIDINMRGAFETAKVPLVINRKSLDTPRHYQFYIQILIIFEIFSSKINKIIDQTSIEKVRNNALLNTINSICKLLNLPIFADFDAAVKNDSIPKFVISFLKNIGSIKNETIENVTIKETVKRIDGSERLTENQITNIKSTIEFLKTLKNQFKILNFNFDFLHDVETSTILFYANFLNCFFLTIPKNEMYQRTVRLLNIDNNFKDEYDFRLFSDIKIFQRLLHFLNTGSFQFNEMKNDNIEDLFQQADVPMIIDHSILEIAKKRSFFPIFYQLQFIFNAIDQKESRTISKLFASAIYKLKKVEVIDFKFIQLKYRIEMNRKYGNLDESEIFEKNNDQISTEKVNDFQKIATAENEEEEEKALSDYGICQKYLYESGGYKYENGIIFNEKTDQKLSQTDWSNEMTIIQKSISIEKSNKEDQALLLCRKKSSTMQTKLYKIFEYDEDEKIWTYNKYEFRRFSKDKRIDITGSKTPLILLINSYEDELITFCSTLFNIIFPDLSHTEKDNIFIYALCEQSLLNLNYLIDFNDSEKSSIKPIFLLLHVPKSKKDLESIIEIPTQVYSFLSTICDLEITLLNKNHYLSQIEYINHILSINRFYDKKYNNKYPFNFSINQIYNEFENDKELNYDEMNDFDDNPKFSYKEPRFILLINDSMVEYNKEIDNKINRSDFFNNNLKNQISNECLMHFININDFDSYENFMKSLNEMVKNHCSLYNEVFDNLLFIKRSRIDQAFINLTSKVDYHDDLENLIFARFQTFKTNVLYNGFSLQQMLDLLNSTILVLAIYNTDFILEAKELIKLVTVDGIRDKRKLLKSELKKYAKYHLNSINDSLVNKNFLSFKQMISIINSHKAFLKENFFNIIKSNFNDEHLMNFYSLNFNIIKRQMENDEIFLLKLFKPFIDKIKMKEIFKFQNIRSEQNSGTNYAMKETENLREVKITVNIDKDLKSKIEQDF